MKKLLSLLLAVIMVFSALLPSTLLTYATEYTAIPQSASDPVIACWGDSLTYGQGGTNAPYSSYPARLSNMTGLTVHNMGVGGETAVTIAARQGGLDIKLTEAVTIPADTSEVEISFAAYNQDGSYAGVIVPRNVNIAGWNPCTINGVEGALSVSVNTDVSPRVLNWAKFKRTTAGTATEAAIGTEVKVAGQDIAKEADINIFFTGTNGGWNENHTNPSDTQSADLVALTDKMIAATKAGSKNLVIGLTTGGASSWTQTNAALKAKYGDHFIDAKAYLSSAEALAEAGLTGTATPGVIPSVFVTEDNVHLNDLGYHLLANLVYDKLTDLGYVTARTSLVKHMEATDASHFASYTANGGTVTTAGGVGGRRADDISMKVTYNGPSTDCFTNISNLPTIGTAPSVVALSLYPSADMTNLTFARGASESTSKAIRFSELKANQWNRIVCYYDPTTFTSKLYINGVEVSSSCKTNIEKPTRTDVRIIMNFNKSKAGAEFYYDDIAVYTGSTYVNPAIISTQYTIQDKYINKWGTDTVGTFKSKIGLGADTYNIKVYNQSGTLKQDNEALASTDNVHLCDGSAVLERYYMGSSTSTVADATNIDHSVVSYRTAAELASLAPLYYCTTGQTETGVGGRPDTDAAAKITYLGERTTSTGAVVTGEDCFIDIPIPAADATKPLFITLGLYPNEHYNGFQFASGGSQTITSTIPASALKLNAWNKLGLLYDPDSLTAKVYIDDKLYNTYNAPTVKAINQNKIRLICWQNKANAVNEVFYLDDIAIFSGTALLPTISKSNYDIADKWLYDTIGETVNALTSGINLNGYTLTVYNSGGTAKSGTETIVSGDTIRVMFDNILIEEYFAAGPKPPSATTIKEAKDAGNLASLTAAYSTTSVVYGVGDTEEGDASLKLTFNGQQTGTNGTVTYGKDAYMNITTSPTVHTTPFVVSVSVYPVAPPEGTSNQLSSIAFAKGPSELISSNISPSSLNMNEWNTLVCYHDPIKLTSKIYINGVEVPSSCKSSFNTNRNEVRLLTNFVDSTTSAGTEIYYDDISVISGNLIYPYVTECDMTIDGKYLHGWDSKTVADIKDAFMLAATTYSTRVVNSTGSVKEDSSAIEKADTIEIICGNSVLTRYIPGIESYKMLSDPVLYTDGYCAGDNKFGVGTVTVKQKIGAYSGDLDIYGILAQYNKDGALVNIQVTPQTVSGNDEISASITIENTDETTLKFFAWMSDLIGPATVPKSFTAYSETKIENITPLYEGYTTKSAAFNYDDGVWEEYILLDLFDKYGAKGTFNFISGIGEGTQPTLQSRKEQQITKAKAAGDADALAATDWIDYVKRAYIDKGHEVSSHTRDHWPSHLDEGEISYSSTGVELVGMSTEDEVADIQDGVTDLEGWFGTDVIGLAWPNGFGWQRNDYESDLLPAMEEVGLKYARARENGTFNLPTNWYEWIPTCHHNYAPGYATQFVSLDNSGDMKCLFIWGHAYEFGNAGNDATKNWSMIEGVLDTLATDDTIWYATNGDIYRYVEATKLLETTDTTVKNNSDMTVYLNVNGKNIALEPDETYTIGE